MTDQPQTDMKTDLTPLEEMSLKKLQSYLTELGFIGADMLTTKAQCIKVIENYQIKTAAAQEAIDKAKLETEDTAVKVTDEKGKVQNPLAPTVADKVGEKTDAKRWQGKAAAMKAHLAKQPKVSFLIPLGFGEKRGAYETVIMNGYRLNIMKGVMVEIPRQVAELLAESYQLTAAAGENFLVDRDQAVKENLN